MVHQNPHTTTVQYNPLYSLNIYVISLLSLLNCWKTVPRMAQPWQVQAENVSGNVSFHGHPDVSSAVDLTRNWPGSFL